MNQKLRHRTARKTKHRGKNGFQLSLTNIFLIVAGIILLLIGLYYLLLAGGYVGGSTNMLMNTSEPTDAFAPAKVVAGQGLPFILLYFLPAVLVLILSALYAGKFGSRTYLVSMLAAVYLVIVQIKISFFNFNFGGCFYLTFFIASLFLFIPTIILLGSAFIHRKAAILNVSCIYFYISVLLYSLVYSGPFDLLFPYVLFFSILIFWVSKKIKRPYVNLVNFTFAIGFFGLFWLRKLVVSSKTDFLPEFFIFGILFYLLFYAVTILASQSKERPLRAWMQMVLGWSNLAFFVGTTSFVLVKYYSFGYLWVFVLAVLLFNIAGIYAMKKYKSEAWELPHYFAGIFLAALVLPLLLHQHMVLLFTAGITTGMLVYTIKFKIQASMWLSILAMGAMLVAYLFSWLFRYLSAFIPATELPATALLWHGTISGIVVVLALSVLKWYLEKDIEIPLSKRWFSKTRYNRLIRTIRLIALFFTMGWIGFALAIRLTGTLVYSPAGWFVAGSVFFIAMITYFSGRQSIFKKPVLYFAFSFALLYPLLVFLGTRYYITGLIAGKDTGIAPLLLHYLALAVLLVLGLMTVRRMVLRNSKYPVFRAMAQSVAVFFLVFLVCTEYDTLSIVIASASSTPGNGIPGGEELLASNRYLPWSVLIGLLSVGVFIRAIVRKEEFLKNVSFFLFALVLLKLFALDFVTLSQGGRSAVFIVLGLFLIGVAVWYPRLLKANAKVHVARRKAGEGGAGKEDRKKEEE